MYLYFGIIDVLLSYQVVKPILLLILYFKEVYVLLIIYEI